MDLDKILADPNSMRILGDLLSRYQAGVADESSSAAIEQILSEYRMTADELSSLLSSRTEAPSTDTAKVKRAGASGPGLLSRGMKFLQGLEPGRKMGYQLGKASANKYNQQTGVDAPYPKGVGP